MSRLQLIWNALIFYVYIFYLDQSAVNTWYILVAVVSCLSLFVTACSSAGLKESAGMPWAHTSLIAEVIDEARRQLGVTYDQDNVQWCVLSVSKGANLCLDMKNDRLWIKFLAEVRAHGITVDFGGAWTVLGVDGCGCMWVLYGIINILEEVLVNHDSVTVSQCANSSILKKRN